MQIKHLLRQSASPATTQQAAGPTISRTVVGIERKTGSATEELRNTKYDVTENCCFANSSLHGLSRILDLDQLENSIPPFPAPDTGITEVHTIGHGPREIACWVSLRNSILHSDEYFDLPTEVHRFLEMLSTSTSTTSSVRLRRVVAKLRQEAKERRRFHGLKQEDASEFLLYLINTLQQAMKARSGPQSPTYLDKVLKHSVRTTFMCENCGHENVNQDLAFIKTITLPSDGDTSNLTLQSALNASMVDETLTDYVCDKCRNKCSPDCDTEGCLACKEMVKTHLKSLAFSGLGEYLILSFNRNKSGSKEKIMEGVTFLTQDTKTTAIDIKSDGKIVTFEMDAVVKHEGECTNEGHYVCFKRDDGKWWECDDENVHDVSKWLDGPLDYIQKRRGQSCLIFLRRLE